MASGASIPQAAEGFVHLRSWLRGTQPAAGAALRPSHTSAPADDGERDLDREIQRGVASRACALVGVLNVTPDSFSDGGRHFEPAAARAHVDRLLAEGADVIEIGGESTRPAGSIYGAGFTPVDVATQIERVLPAIHHAARERRARVAIDTTRAPVASAALDAGASIVNDVSCLADVELARVAARHGAWLVLMHSREGASSVYRDVVADVAEEWCAARDRAVAAGVRRDLIVFDPGIGFGKDAAQSLALLAALPRFATLGHAIYVGASRKSFIAEVDARYGRARSAPTARLGGTIAAALHAARNGAAALRVHDVEAVRQALAVERAIDGAIDAADARGAR